MKQMKNKRNKSIIKGLERWYMSAATSTSVIERFLACQEIRRTIISELLPKKVHFELSNINYGLIVMQINLLTNMLKGLANPYVRNIMDTYGDKVPENSKSTVEYDELIRRLDETYKLYYEIVREKEESFFENKRSDCIECYNIFQRLIEDLKDVAITADVVDGKEVLTYHCPKSFMKAIDMLCGNDDDFFTDL